MPGELLIALPILLPLVGAPVCYALNKKSRTAGDVLAALICAAVLVLTVILGADLAKGEVRELTIPAFGSSVFSLRMDGFRTIYVAITAFMWLVATLFGHEYFARGNHTGRFQLFSLLTFAATSGVFLSADFLTTFLFFEWGSLCAYPLVAHDESAGALRAAGTYLAVAIFGGLAILMGLFLLYGMTGTLVISELAAACAAVTDRARLYAAAALIVVGFGAKAGLFPLHFWLPQAHSTAPAPASALLSGVLTKTGVFSVLLVCCELLPGDIGWGTVLLILGLVSMLLGAVLALFSTDLKRTLACSSISQIGFIAVGAAAQLLLREHNALAVRGTLLHMINHSLAKLVLFTVAGIIYANRHKTAMNDIRGWGRGRPLLACAFLAGALSIAGVPFFGGYVSKTLLHESLVECVTLFAELPLGRLLSVAEPLFLVAGGITIAYMVKLFVAIFVEKPTGKVPEKARYMRGLTAVLLIASSILMPVLGILPHRISEPLAAFGEEFMHGHTPEHSVHYMDWINLRGFVISICIGAVLYVVVVRGLLMKRRDNGVEYVDRWPAWLDTEKGARRVMGGGTATLLKPTKTERTVSRFYGKYYSLFYHEKGETHENHTISGSFSLGLLLLGIGLCAVLVWLLLIYIGG